MPPKDFPVIVSTLQIRGARCDNAKATLAAATATTTSATTAAALGVATKAGAQVGARSVRRPLCVPPHRYKAGAFAPLIDCRSLILLAAAIMGGGGGGKSSRSGGGKGKYRGGMGSGPYERSGPILDEPPLYPPDKMADLPKARFPISKEDNFIVETNRRLLSFWKRSPFHQELGGEDPDTRMNTIINLGGLSANYFPQELCLKQQLKVKGRATEKSVLNALKKIERKENEHNEKSTGEKDGEGDGEGDEKEIDRHRGDGGADEDDDEFGDDDYVACREDFEDGMGDDFNDDVGGGGEGELT